MPRLVDGYCRAVFGDALHEVGEVVDDAVHDVQGVVHEVGDVLHDGVDRLTEEMGGPAGSRVVVLLAAVLGLASADIGTISALALQLEHSLHIGNPQLGLLVTVSALVGAVGTVPMGAVVDRFPRVRVLSWSIVAWALAQSACAFATSWIVLLGIRVALGAVTATAGPTVASLTGDLFPPKDRGRMWGFILTGEVVGTGCGVLLAGLVAAAFGWRPAFIVLAVPSLVLAWALHRLLPEPARGGQSHLESGAGEVPSAEEVDALPVESPGPAGGVPEEDDLVAQLVAGAGVEPDEDLVLGEPPEEMSLWQAVRYVVKVRTNVVLIVASALGYFFLSGLETFVVIFLRGQYGLSQAMATVVLVVVGLGVIAGLLGAGRVSDRVLRRGRIDARLLAGVVGFLGAAVLLAPAIASRWLALSLPLFVLAGALLAAPNPGLDAARLDVVPARLWGRAEGVRTLLRQVLQAFAPLVFGLLTVAFGGMDHGLGAAVTTSRVAVSPAQSRALELTFLVMLAPVVVGGLGLLLGRKSYPVDVASAAESDSRSRAARQHDQEGLPASRTALSA